MISLPYITTTKEAQTAVIHLQIPRSQIQEVMHPAVMEIIDVVTKQGFKPISPMFTRHFKITAESFDFEVSFEVNGIIEAEGRVKPSTLPATTVARTVYHGGYEGLGNAWGELRQWVTEQQLQYTTHLWEVYLIGHNITENTADFRTELNLPIV